MYYRDINENQLEGLNTLKTSGRFVFQTNRPLSFCTACYSLALLTKRAMFLRRSSQCFKSATLR